MENKLFDRNRINKVSSKEKNNNRIMVAALVTGYVTH